MILFISLYDCKFLESKKPFTNVLHNTGSNTLNVVGSQSEVFYTRKYTERLRGVLYWFVPLCILRSFSSCVYVDTSAEITWIIQGNVLKIFPRYINSWKQQKATLSNKINLHCLLSFKTDKHFKNVNKTLKSYKDINTAL